VASAPVPASRLLVVDDDPYIPVLIERFARKLGFDVASRGNGRDALDALSELRPDVTLVDLQMPELTGIDVLKAVRAADPECRVILMTGNATLETAIEAVKAGALDYLSKPLDFERLGTLLADVRDSIQQRERMMEGDAAVALQFEFHGMIGRSPVMQELFDAIRRLAVHARTVLISGEKGTGKTLVAAALHKAGPRHADRFVSLDCAGAAHGQVERGLFGQHWQSSAAAGEAALGMFDQADGGTLFLDEIGALPLATQAKLLRAVEFGEVQPIGAFNSRSVDVHVLAATSRDLRAESAGGRFRMDLYHRLSVVDLRVPPLRERVEDIPYLTARFISDCAARLNRSITGVAPSAERLLQQAPWPGNVTQLRDVIERACALGESRILGERDFAAALASPPVVGGSTVLRRREAGATGAPEDASIADAQREHITRVLREAGGNKAAAAKLLKISRRSLYRWIDRLHLSD
jgi:two-component system response regulator HydG